MPWSGTDASASRSIDLDTAFSDPDGDALTYSLLSNSNTGAVTASVSGTRNKDLSLSAVAGASGSATVEVGVDDGNGGAITRSFTATVSPAASAGSAVGSTDFSDYALGAQPSDWSAGHWDAGQATWTVEAVTGGQALRDVSTGTARGFLRWDRAPASTTQEVLWRHERTQNPNNWCNHGMALVFASGDGSSESAYIGYIRTEVNVAVNSVLRIAKLVSGTFTTIGEVDLGFNVGLNVKMWQRLRAEAGRVKVKAWQDGNAEPGAWMVDVADTAHTTGRIGVQSNSPITQVYHDFAYATGGAAAAL